VKVEQDVAVRRLGDRREKGSVLHLVGARRQVIDARLEGKGPAQGGSARAYVGGGDGDAVRGLTGGQQETGGPHRRFVEAQMLAGPRRIEPFRPAPKLRQMAMAAAARAADGIADAMQELGLRQCLDRRQDLWIRADGAAGAEPLDPEAGRLDLGNLDDIRVSFEQAVESGPIDRPDAQLSRDPSHLCAYWARTSSLSSTTR
jgi:hypothetical protein